MTLIVDERIGSTYRGIDRDEWAVLGIIIREPPRLWDALEVGLSGADFTRTEHGRLFELFHKAVADGHPLSAGAFLGLYDRTPIKDRALLPNVDDVLGWEDAAPVGASIRAYAERLVRTARLRRLRDGAREIAARADVGHEDPEELAMEAAHMLHDPAIVGTPSETTDLSSIIGRALDRLEDVVKCGLTPTLPFGWAELDHITGGVAPGELVVVAARPSMGKTAFIQQLARRLTAAKGADPLVVYNYEGTDEAIALRHILAAADVSPLDIRRGRITSDDIEAMRAAAERYDRTGIGRRLHVVGDASMTVPRIEADIVARERRGDILAGIVVDYLQLVPAADPRLPREQQVASISGGLRQIANRHSLPVFALAQLNRQLEQRSNKRPQLSDLRESGSLEQDADMVLFLHREAYYADADSRSEAGEAEVIVAKHRNGSTGTAHLWFERGRFFDHPPAHHQRRGA